MHVKTNAETEVMVEKVREARRRHPILQLDAYCENPACPVREVSFRVKDQARSVVPAIRRRGGLTCPVCGRHKMSLHAVRAAPEHTKHLERLARWSANEQIYRRDHAAEDELVAVNLGAVLRDELPPTPPGWWDDRRRDR